MRAVLLLLIGVALAAAGCGGDGGDDSRGDGTTTAAATSEAAPRPEQDPGEFFEQLFGFYFAGDYARAWGLLHPGHRAVVPRPLFERCLGSLLEGSGIELEDVAVIGRRDEAIDLPAVPERRATAVTIRLTVTNAFGDREDTTPTYNLVPVGGRWTWVLGREEVLAYQRGACPR